VSTPPAPPSTSDEMPLVRSLDLGDMRVHAIEAGLQRLDGGAMFGVVPKPLWERRIPPDERNRITLGLRCLLVETKDELVLIETGLGNKSDEKFVQIYGVETAPPEGASGADRLQAAIHRLGFSRDDVGIVINTHLHFDHAGGNTYRADDGEIRVTFPKARYFVQRGEWEFAHRLNERTRASHLPYDYDPVFEAGRFELLGGPGDVLPGISVTLTPGHTPHHQSVILASGGQKACYMADVVPTMAHLPLPSIMGYDLEPLVTLESKRALLARAAAEEWLLVSVHDAVYPWGRIRFDGRSVEFEPEAGERHPV
jgi:glyoxylase-like metal-dependent hydrolase (beta-lactamase superfamily II)